MSDDTQQPIVVKRIKKEAAAGAHGGAWKIAYADFVTAMMAFFLMMWLLGSTAQGDLQGIADQFQNPLKLSMQGGSGVGDSSSIVQGGGEDLSRKVGQVRRGDTPSTRAINIDAAKRRQKGGPSLEGLELEKRREHARLIDLKGRIEALLEANTQLRMFKNQILIDIVSEGLRIQLVDEKNRPMFDLSSAELHTYTRELLHAIGMALNDVDNRVSLSGHTDSARYAGGERGFSNWELSANRANAARRELIAGGLGSDKIVRVVGLSDTIHLDSDNPLDPINRRISIIVLNKESEKAMRDEAAGHKVETSWPPAAPPAEPGQDAGPSPSPSPLPFSGN
ncbi:MAG: flagellar motor protein MotB [Azoarcus sp.]|nr:flagellar motor protein MotB [Azoarcus sp.]